MASALQRMRLYEQAYGLTELRLYVVVFLGWLGAVFGWFSMTVLRDRGTSFLFGAAAAAAIVLVLLNLGNPDRQIAARNAGRAAQAVPFDAQHTLGLSADAVPALVSRLGLLEASDRCLVARTLLQRWSRPTSDPRSWNWGRQRAHQAVLANRGELEAACP
jgi:hypothetical protein